MEKPIKIGLLGAGTVGSGVLQVLHENAKEVSQKAGAPVEIKTVLVRDAKKPRPYMDGLVVTDRIEDILEDEDISIVVELMGGLHPAREYMLAAMEAGKHVVTANKDVIAQFGADMFDAAGKHSVGFLFEASVGGGIPIIRPIMECLTANRITEVMGIVNGTTNYMLTKMTELGEDYQSVLREAQDKGYAEANPAADVEGLDAARKAAILASLAFNTRVTLQSVSVEGITEITPEDIDYARQLGYVGKNEKLVKITGLPSAPVMSYNTGTVLKHQSITCLPEWVCKAMGFTVFLCAFVFMLLLDYRHTAVRQSKRQKTHKVSKEIPVYDLPQI